MASIYFKIRFFFEKIILIGDLGFSSCQIICFGNVEFNFCVDGITKWRHLFLIRLPNVLLNMIFLTNMNLYLLMSRFE